MALDIRHRILDQKCFFSAKGLRLWEDLGWHFHPSFRHCLKIQKWWLILYPLWRLGTGFASKCQHKRRNFMGLDDNQCDCFQIYLNLSSLTRLSDEGYLNYSKSENNDEWICLINILKFNLKARIDQDRNASFIWPKLLKLSQLLFYLSRFGLLLGNFFSAQTFSNIFSPLCGFKDVWHSSLPRVVLVDHSMTHSYIATSQASSIT